MKKNISLSQDAIMAVPVDCPEKLFSNSLSEAKLEYGRLAKAWHPDHCLAGGQVMAQINVLYERVQEKIKDGSYAEPGTIKFKKTDGSFYQVSYQAHHPFELGDLYISDTELTYAITKDNADLYERAKAAMSVFKFADAQMLSEMSRFLPKISKELKTADRLIMTIPKTADVFSLRDVMNHLKGKLDPKHAAWVISRLYNLGCYLKYAGLTHNDISPDTFFISPSQHTGHLLGGWWYSASIGRDLRALPNRSLNIIDPGFEPVASYKYDLDLLRATGREILGDITGSKLVRDKNIPKPLMQWAMSVGSSDAMKEYGYWMNTVLVDSFGARRFVELKLTSSDIYGA